MITLAIETSGLAGSVALSRAADLLGERRLTPEIRHAQQLVPVIKELLAESGFTPRDCELIAVSHGPGSFTGLRVGIVCAKTLSYATGAKLTAVSTHLAIAAQSPEDVSRVQVITGAQRDEVFHEEFIRDESGRWRSTAPLRIIGREAWINTLNAEDCVSGPGVELCQAELECRCRILPVDLRQPGAVTICRLGQQQALRGELTSCWELEPLYIRKSAAEEKWDATHPPA